MTNYHKGDIPLTINGEERRLRLTMQALSDIETDFGLPINEIGLRMVTEPRIADLMVFIHRMAQAGDWPDATFEDIQAATITPSDLEQAVAAAFYPFVDESSGKQKPTAKKKRA